MIVNEERKKRQIEGVKLWYKSGKNGIFNYAPGVGKTYTTQLCIKYLEKIDKGSYLLLAPNEKLVKQWEEKNNYLPKYLKNKIIIKTPIQVLNEKVLYEVDTLIIDEIHTYHTDDKIKLLDKSIIKNKNFIGLSGTCNDDTFKRILKYYKIIDTITTEEAREKGYIADFIEYNIPVSLSEKEKIMYDDYSKTYDELLAYFPSIDWINKITDGGKDSKGVYYNGLSYAKLISYKHNWKEDLDLSIETHNAINKLWNPNIIVSRANALSKIIRYRIQLLQECSNKYIMVSNIINRYNIKSIVFSDSTFFTDNIYEVLKKEKKVVVKYHTKLPTIMKTGKTGKLIKYGQTRQKKDALTILSSNPKAIMCTTKALDTGIDIPDIKLSIITSGSYNPIQQEQRIGRSTRNDGTEDVVLLFNIYAKDTQEEKSLKSRQVGAKHSIIKLLDLDDLDNIQEEVNRVNFNEEL